MSNTSDSEDDIIAICIKCKNSFTIYDDEDEPICDECQDKLNCIVCNTNSESIPPGIAGICRSCSKEGWKCYYDYCKGETFPYKKRT